MIASDIGVVEHALRRFREYSPRASNGVTDDILEGSLKELILARFYEKKWSQHILDELQEAWVVSLRGARVGDVPVGGKIIAVVKGDDLNPDNHWVVVTFLDEETALSKFNKGHWQPFDVKKKMHRSSGSKVHMDQKPLTFRMGERIKEALAQETIVPESTTIKPSAPPPAKPEAKKTAAVQLTPAPKPTRLISYVNSGHTPGYIEITSDKLSGCIEDLVDQGVNPESIRVWSPVKLKKRVVIEEEE